MSYVAGGYLVSMAVPRAPYNDAAIVADEVWSASECLAPRLSSWTLAWVDVERATRAAALGVTDLDALVAWFTAAFDAGNVGWPDVFFTLDAAREARNRFAPSVRSRVALGSCGRAAGGHRRHIGRRWSPRASTW
jgi:hypothetical protein